MNNTKTTCSLRDIIYFIAFSFTMVFAISLVSLSGVSVRTVLDAANINTAALISRSALGTLISAAVCVAARLSDLKGRTVD